MKKILVALVALGAVPASASAASLPFSTGSSAYSYSPPVFSWNGVYAGANVGYAFMGNSYYDVAAEDAYAQATLDAGAPTHARSRTNGFAGGLQVGYNLQVGNRLDPFFGTLAGIGSGIVVGVEADTDYTAQRGGGVPYATSDGYAAFRSHTDYVGTVRGRLGYAIDRFLVYGTGGFAFGGVRDKATYYDGVGATTFAGRTDRVKTGYAYGGGFEYALPTFSFLSFIGRGTVTAKAEYLHYDLGRSSFVAGGPLGSYAVRVKDDGNVARAGLNYKFDPFGY